MVQLRLTSLSRSNFNTDEISNIVFQSVNDASLTRRPWVELARTTGAGLQQGEYQDCNCRLPRGILTTIGFYDNHYQCHHPGISLCQGAFGVMNIMLVSVTEHAGGGAAGSSQATQG